MANNPGKKSGKLSSTQKEFLIFISIPLSIVLIVALLVLVPNFLAKPKYDFIYRYCPEYTCSSDYSVDQNGRLTATLPNVNNLNSYSKAPELYYYSVSTNSTRRIDLAEADSYVLNSANVSPDGYTLTQGNSSGDGGFLFWGYSGDNSWYLKDGLKKKQVNLNNPVYSYDISFLGWVRK